MKRRRSLVSPESASPEVSDIFTDIKRAFESPHVPNLFQVMANDPEHLAASWLKIKVTTCSEGRLPALLKQLILFQISRRGGNDYCTNAHAYLALGLDDTLSFDELLDMSEGDAFSKFPTPFQVAIRVATAAALQPELFASDDFDPDAELRGVGFDDQEITEIFAQADSGQMLNVFCACNEVPLDAPEHLLGRPPEPHQLPTYPTAAAANA